MSPGHRTPGSSSQEEPEGFLFISTPFLPCQRTLPTPKQAPRQVLQGVKEHYLIRGKIEKVRPSLTPCFMCPVSVECAGMKKNETFKAPQ